MDYILLAALTILACVCYIWYRIHVYIIKSNAEMEQKYQSMLDWHTEWVRQRLSSDENSLLQAHAQEQQRERQLASELSTVTKQYNHILSLLEWVKDLKELQVICDRLSDDWII